MRKITDIILHCTATPAKMDIGVKEVDKWHRHRGWKGCGYHVIIRRDGTVEYGRPMERVGAHTKGHNRHSIGVAYAGGVDLDGKPEDNLTAAQEKALINLVEELRRDYGALTVSGHNQYSPKACPSFIVSEKFPDING